MQNHLQTKLIIELSDFNGIYSSVRAPSIVISLSPQMFVTKLPQHTNQAARILAYLPISYW